MTSETKMAITAGIDAGERFIAGECITFECDIYAWQAALSLCCQA